MKKIALVLALIASLQVADAQVKSNAAAKSAVESAQAAADNPKKATKVATWMKLGQTLIEAYDAPQGSAWVGATKQDLQLIMGNTKPTSVEDVVIEGQAMSKEVYPNCNYYFRDGVLTMIEVTNPAVPNALDRAVNAYKEAYKVDAKKTKTADIANALKSIGQKYVEQAYNAYSFGEFAKSSELFESAFNTTKTTPCAAVDTNALFNTALTAWIAKDFGRAKSFFTKCLDEYKYEGSDGDVYAKLADIYEKEGDKAAVKEILERGFASHPQSQGILIGLINYYISNQEDPGRLFDLIGQAKQNEPNNASLYYVEGNIYKELGKIDEAIAAYEKCAEINPDYEYGYIGEGILYYNQAIDIQEKASNEMDDAKYMVLAEQFEKSLKNCIEPFEKAFNITKDEALKVSLAEYLKNACYRFASEDENYKAAYDKYAKIVADGKVE